MPLILAKDVNNSTYAVEIDPTGFFEKQGTNPYLIFDNLGLIPGFMFNDEFLDRPAWEALDSQYVHGGGLYVNEATITDEGLYQYPGDPDLYPLAKYTRAAEIIYQYQYGVMAVPKDGVLTPTCMD